MYIPVLQGRSSRVLWSREKVVSEQLGAEEDILSHLRLQFCMYWLF